MGKTWILDTETKGTGAHVAPLDESAEKPASPKRRRRRRSAGSGRQAPAPAPRRRREKRQAGKSEAEPLPPGHVRKKATGEIGRVQAVDPKAGTARVLWLRQGRASTVPLASVSRR